MSIRKDPATNHLIESLPIEIGNELLKRLTLVDWKFGKIVCEANQRYEHVYFPLTGFISLLTMAGENHPLEMGMIGNEGMLGVSLVLGVNKVPLQAVVQGSGTALSISAEQFQHVLIDFPDLSIILMRYTYVLMQQLAIGGACLHFHAIESRLARWLLMTQDRSHTDKLYITHTFLAYMLGVRRSSVSVAANSLQKQGLISYFRGKINVLDRKGLEMASCQCYQDMTDSYNWINIS